MSSDRRAHLHSCTVPGTKRPEAGATAGQRYTPPGTHRWPTTGPQHRRRTSASANERRHHAGPEQLVAQRAERAAERGPKPGDLRRRDRLVLGARRGAQREARQVGMAVEELGRPDDRFAVAHRIDRLQDLPAAARRRTPCRHPACARNSRCPGPRGAGAGPAIRRSRKHRQQDPDTRATDQPPEASTPPGAPDARR